MFFLWVRVLQIGGLPLAIPDVVVGNPMKREDFVNARKAAAASGSTPPLRGSQRGGAIGSARALATADSGAGVGVGVGISGSGSGGSGSDGISSGGSGGGVVSPLPTASRDPLLPGAVAEGTASASAGASGSSSSNSSSAAPAQASQRPSLAQRSVLQAMTGGGSSSALTPARPTAAPTSAGDEHDGTPLVAAVQVQVQG